MGLPVQERPCGFPGLSKFASLRSRAYKDALKGNNISGSGGGGLRKEEEEEEGNQSCSDVHKVKDGDGDDADGGDGAFQASQAPPLM